MNNGLIFLPPIAASYFRQEGFALVDALPVSQKPYMEYPWGNIALRKVVSTFEPIDFMHIDIDIDIAGAKITENIGRHVDTGEPTYTLMLEIERLPISVADALIGKPIDQLLENAPQWLAHGLEDSIVTGITHSDGATRITSRPKLVQHATSLKIWSSSVESKNFRPVLGLNAARETYLLTNAEMTYDD